MNQYKIILFIFLILLFSLFIKDDEKCGNNNLDLNKIFQNTPKNSYENAITTIRSKVEQIKKQKYQMQLELKQRMHEEKIRKEQHNLEKQYSSLNNKINTEWRNFHATYYSNDCRGCSGITATGINVQETIYFKNLRIVAVDPTIIPLGTIVEIQTRNERFKAIAADKGGAIKGYRLDILVESEKIAVQYGRHDVQVLIIK
ncbi:UNVERIFIED_CONTAM: 3D (Asp-Asp-Asp) domain-containing protein [Lysinibacillus xylanilyticus]|uniref:3D domain-containing protein n=1 Tax=Lysinibacillus xylanilyticus TaxID=582475 RepID=UPI00067179A8|nr:3D domain-containing protein [Lysinibacillus xylanilyticus]